MTFTRCWLLHIANSRSRTASSIAATHHHCTRNFLIHSSKIKRCNRPPTICRCKGVLLPLQSAATARTQYRKVFQEIINAGVRTTGSSSSSSVSAGIFSFCPQPCFITRRLLTLIPVYWPFVCYPGSVLPGRQPHFRQCYSRGGLLQVCKKEGWVFKQFLNRFQS